MPDTVKPNPTTSPQPDARPPEGKGETKQVDEKTLEEAAKERASTGGYE